MSTSSAARCFISLSRSSVSVLISPITNFLNFSNSSRRFSNASFHSLFELEVGGEAGEGEGVAVAEAAATVAITGGVSDRLNGADSLCAADTGGVG